MTTTLLCTTLQLAAAIAPAETPFHGVNAGAPIWGGAILFDSAKASAIAATGCRTVRINFRLDGNASWNGTLLAKYDTIIQNAVNNNIQVLGLVCNELMPVGQNVYNDDPDNDGLNQYVYDFSAAAYLLIDRYKTQIKRWEIWNEPDAWTNGNYANDPKNAGGTYILPKVYANLLVETYKQCNYYSGRTVLTTNGITLSTGGLFAHEIGGSNPMGFSYQYIGQVYSLNGSLWTWMQNNVGRRYPWDTFGYHFYLKQGESFSSSQLASYLNTMQTRKNANNDATPFLITEFGWNSLYISEALQAANLRDAFNYLESRADVARAYWYQWGDEPGASWGLVRSDNSHKPAYDEFVAQQPPPTPPPVAAFVGSPTSGVAPLLVNFTDQSTGSITSRAWNFGDAGTSGLQNPSHTYTSPGTYTVTLTVTGPGGSDVETKTNYISVQAPPASADFDEDGDVDVTDFLYFQICFNGPNNPPLQAECDYADLDDDNDVDINDFTLFQVCFNGPNNPPAGSCPTN